MPLATCPDRQTWDRLIDGRLPAEESRVLEDHLGSCQHCAASLSDTLLGLSPDTQIAPGLPSSQEFAPIASELKSLWYRPPAASTSASELAEYTACFAPLLPGETGLGRLGHYVIQGLLGRGGMGCVLAARDSRLNRQVAIKIMAPALARDPRQTSRFLREAQAVAGIHNDHVIEIHHVDEDRGVPYFVMPLLKGETLEARLRREGRLPDADVLRIGKEIAQGLAAAHVSERKVIHRDIKPANIWLESGSQRVKLLDFGLAMGADVDLKLTEPGSLLGSATYMSPEQARCSAEIDERTDLFSLGSVLYEMATGRIAFRRDGLLNTLNAVAAKQPVPPAEIVPDLSPKFCGLLTRLLAKNPADRPATAQAVVAELESLQRASERMRADQTEVLPPRQLNQSSGVDRPPGRKLVMAAGAAAALSAVFFAVIVINLNHKEQLEIVLDDSFQATILEHNQVLLKNAKQNSTIRLTPGQHEFEVLLKNADGEELGQFKTKDFQIARGGKPVLNIRQRALEAGVTLPAPAAGSEDPEHDRRVANRLLTHPGVAMQGLLDGKGLQLFSGQEVPPQGSFMLVEISVPVTLARSQDVALLEGLRHLRSVIGIGQDFKNDDLKILCSHLLNCPSLSGLYFRQTAIDDAGLIHLQPFDRLNYLALSATGVTDAGLQKLAKLKQLHILDVSEDNITDEGLVSVARLKELRTLRVGNTQVTDDGLVHLRNMTRCEALFLDATRVTDQGLENLLQVIPKDHLYQLSLENTAVSDELIPSLIEIPNLKHLGIRFTKISAAGANTLRQKFPEANIVWAEPAE